MQNIITKFQIIAAALAISHAVADDIPTTPATLQIGHTNTDNAALIKLIDFGNHTWVLQSSADLTDWHEVQTVKVFNGFVLKSFPNENPSTFFRVIYGSAEQEILSSVENALILPASIFNYAAPILPRNFLVPPIIGQDNTPANNPVSDSGATLGRVLFYDKRLSSNQTVSCSSCHQQQHGFSDTERFSTGFAGGKTARNSMGLSNARYYLRRHFFWDERANTLEDQVLQPIQNPTEMGMTLPLLETRVGSEPFYTNLFARAFGSTNVTSSRISFALAQFVRTILSTRSKFDVGTTNGFSNFTPQENLGRQIFFGQVGRATCATCHATDNFVPGANIFNNGLENPYIDKGVGGISGLPQDEGLFKVPSLRNIELTAPYMHDGRFATLEEVVEFYNSGVVNHPNLSPPLRVPPGPGNPPGAPLRLNLTPVEKAALVSFLKTLTDLSITTDPKYTDPFDYGN